MSTLQRIGASITVNSLSDLATLSVKDLTPGTVAYCLFEDEYYRLATGDTGAVAADGVAGLFWRAEVNAKQGDDLASGNTTVVPGAGASQFTLDDGTLVENSFVTLSDTGVADGLLVQIVRRDLSAFDYVVKDHDGTTALFTFAGGSAPKAATFVWSDADGVWKLANYLFVA